jgi:hypothetical protein
VLLRTVVSPEIWVALAKLGIRYAPDEGAWNGLVDGLVMACAGLPDAVWTKDTLRKPATTWQWRLSGCGTQICPHGRPKGPRT